jgi:hypothetical protein
MRYRRKENETEKVNQIKKGKERKRYTEREFRKGIR